MSFIGDALNSVGNVVGSLLGSNASNSAANTQANAANQASQTQLQMFNTLQQNLNPYKQAGLPALQQLSQGTAPGGQFNSTFTPDQYTQSPGYQWQLQQGMNAMNNQANAAGMGLSSANLQSLGSYVTGAAQQDYHNAYNQWLSNRQSNMGNIMGLAGMGQNAAAGIGAGAMQTGNSIASNQIGAGNALAAGQIGSANAWSGGLNNILNQQSQQGMLSQLNNMWGGNSFLNTPALSAADFAGSAGSAASTAGDISSLIDLSSLAMTI
jgi:hypothetical protein